MACECDGFARQSSKLLDKVRFLGELLTVAGRLRSAVRLGYGTAECAYYFDGAVR